MLFGHIGFHFIFFAISLLSLEVRGSIPQNATSRDGKVFSLFSIVQFKNGACRSQSALTSGQSQYRNGTCYTSSECSSKGGTASGNCAAGFGVCCLFLVSSSGGTIRENCTYIRNPGFPTPLTSTGGITYTITKCIPEVCYLRLDFETFTIAGPADTNEPTGGLCQDTFVVTVSSGQPIPTICGMNTGQHIYVDVGALSTDTATLSFTINSAVTNVDRQWEIKVSQIECYNANRPIPGCLQYWTTLTGRITTFNFLSTTTSNLQLQDYTACVRRADGYCCIQYQVCEGVPDAFTLDGSDAMSLVTTANCITDYIDIPGGADICTVNSATVLNKFCGRKLNIQGAQDNNIPICDCTSPFEVSVHTDDTGEGANARTSRGNCLDFQQLPCTS